MATRQFDRDRLALAGGLAAIGIGIFALIRSQTRPHCPSGYVLDASGKCVAKPPAPGACLVCPTSIGTPPASQLASWLQTDLGWYPQPGNLPPGWFPGSQAPQPSNAVAPQFIWTGSAWVPNPANMPPGWRLLALGGSCLVCPTSIGTPPPAEAGNWVRSTGGWYPQPRNLPPGWFSGSQAPQPSLAVAPRFVWTGAGWVPNPARIPSGWSL